MDGDVQRLLLESLHDEKTENGMVIDVMFILSTYIASVLINMNE